MIKKSWQAIALSGSIMLVGATAALAGEEARIEKAEFVQWAEQHPEWVATHHDRYDYFCHRPDEAEKFRHEWADWKAEHHEFAEWADRHPEWVEKNRKRAEFFRSHPEDGAKFVNEWAEEKHDMEKKWERN